jgi:hypothetical protein
VLSISFYRCPLVNVALLAARLISGGGVSKVATWNTVELAKKQLKHVGRSNQVSKTVRKASRLSG